MATLIQRSFGGSALTVKSGGVLNIESGGSLGLTPTATTGATVYPLFKAGNNTIYYMAGSAGASPNFSASPGDLLWFANSASTTMFVNISNGTAGSRWSSFRRTDAGSQIPS